MINIIFQIAFTTVVIYFVYDDSGIVIAIVVGWLLLSLSAIYWLYNDQKQKVSYLLNAMKTNDNLISDLEGKLDKLSKSNEELIMYTKRHGYRLDGLDNRLPNLKYEE